MFPAGDALARELVRLSCLVPCGSCLLAKAGVEAQPTTGAAGHAHIDYERELFDERQLRSVTANTRADGTTFLRLAAEHGIRATTTAYAMEDADQALADLAHGRFSGAAVLHN